MFQWQLLKAARSNSEYDDWIGHTLARVLREPVKYGQEGCSASFKSRAVSREGLQSEAKVFWTLLRPTG